MTAPEKMLGVTGQEGDFERLTPTQQIVFLCEVAQKEIPHVEGVGSGYGLTQAVDMALLIVLQKCQDEQQKVALLQALRKDGYREIMSVLGECAQIVRCQESARLNAQGIMERLIPRSASQVLGDTSGAVRTNVPNGLLLKDDRPAGGKMEGLV